MNRQLLLLLALVGPFCAFTHASPTVLPEDHTENTETGTHVTSTYATKITEGSFYVISPLATETSMAPTEVTTDMVQKMSTPPNSEDFHTTTDATAAPEPLTTTPPPPTAVETEGPAETEQSIVTGVAESETGEEVVVEGDVAEGVSSGQLVGIVIGALLAVVIFIAVVIAVVRRMGKYSP